MGSETPVPFTKNHQDLSTSKGYQFKFHCERCGDGYMSTFQGNTLGQAEGLLDAAASVLGGIFGQLSSGARSLQEVVGGRAHDEAMREAVEEIRPLFVQCRRCGKWTCQKICHNAQAKMCKDCAPVAEEEESAIRAGHVQTQVANDLFLEENKRMSAKAKEVAGKCTECGEATLGKKFCPGCGTPTASAVQNCPKCGNKLSPGAKFCGDCGTKTTPA